MKNLTVGTKIQFLQNNSGFIYTGTISGCLNDGYTVLNENSENYYVTFEEVKHVFIRVEMFLTQEEINLLNIAVGNEITKKNQKLRDDISEATKNRTEREREEFRRLLVKLPHME